MNRLLLLVLLPVSLIVVLLIVREPTPRVVNAHPERLTVVCFGDSLTYGTGAQPGMEYPTYLSEFLQREVINAGRPGETTAGALTRLWDDVLVHEPGIVFLTLGGNDLKNGLDREQAFANLTEIVLTIQEQGALVVVGGIDIPFHGRGFAEGYRELAKETGAVLVPNVYADILGRSELMSDPIHPNGKGYRIMAETFYKAASPFL